MQLEDEIEKQTADGLRALQNAKPMPTRRLSRARADAESLDALLTAAGIESGDAHSLLSKLDGEDDDERPIRHAEIVRQEFQLLAERNNDALERARAMRTQLEPIRASIAARRSDVDVAIAQLDAFAREIGAQTLATGELESFETKAKSQLEKLRNHTALLDKQRNYAQKNAE